MLQDRLTAYLFMLGLHLSDLLAVWPVAQGAEHDRIENQNNRTIDLDLKLNVIFETQFSA